MRTCYDFVFSLGAACLCSSALRDAKLQFASCPFDWVSGGSMRGRADIIARGFDEWLLPERLKRMGSTPGVPHDTYQDTCSGMNFPHDFPVEVALSDSLGPVHEKYNRRIVRLTQMISQSKLVLAVWVVDPQDRNPAEDADIIYCRERLMARFPGVTINILVIDFRKPSTASAFARREGPGFCVELCEYRTGDGTQWERFGVDLRPIVRLLSKYHAVDYRSYEEKKSWKRAEREKLYARFNAKTWLGYRFNQWRSKLLGK